MDSSREHAGVGHYHEKDGTEVVEQQRRRADVAYRVGPESPQFKRCTDPSNAPLHGLSILQSSFSNRIDLGSTLS